MTSTVPQGLAPVIKYHRKKAGLSQKALADLAGVGKTVVFDIEHGHTGVKLSTLLKVLHVLNISLKLDGPLMPTFIAAQGEEDA